MKKVRIITINDYINYGNRLQNYALVKYINSHFNVDCRNYYKKSKMMIFKEFIKNIIKNIIRRKKDIRFLNFYRFSKKIPKNNTVSNDCILVAGSDQIWNPSFAATEEELCIGFENNRKSSYAASFGISELPQNQRNRFFNALNSFCKISVREHSAKKIVEELTGRTDVEVLVDPTMLLSAKEWDNISNKPKQINKLCHNGERYILNYFLGEVSKDRSIEIQRVASENNCKIINILDKNDPFYICGPSEFLWLEKNAYLICTDSFHSSVFAILYNTPFVIFEREDKNYREMEKIGTRIDTLLSKFMLEDRRFNGKISRELLKCDYNNAKKILEVEKEKSKVFLQKALDIE